MRASTNNPSVEDLEEDLADREEGVGGEGLCVAQAGVQEEEGVDPPDEGVDSVVRRVSSR